MIIVLDTNIWIEEIVLKSNIGSSFRLYTNFNGIKIAVPEVVRLEFEHNIESRIHELIKNTNDNYNRLLALFGKLKSIKLPNENEIKELVQGLIDNCGISVENLSFSLDSARSSLMKVIKGLPPNGDKNQQFKDGVIWHDCLKLLDRQDVAFITSDKAFYKNKNYQDGLAENLLQEIIGKEYKLKIYSRLSEILPIVETIIPVDINSLVSSILRNNKESIDRMIQEDNITISNNFRSLQKNFATEDSSIIYVEYSIEIDCYKEENDIVITSAIFIKGNAMFNVITSSWTSIKNDYIEYCNLENDKKQKVVFLRVDDNIIGHKTDYFQSKEQLK